MIRKIYVGNLPFSAREKEIAALFAQWGEVISVKLIIDRRTGSSRGFAFVEMAEKEAVTAVMGLDGTRFRDRNLIVNEVTSDRGWLTVAQSRSRMTARNTSKN